MNSELQRIHRRQQEVLEAIGRIDTMRRGALSRQHYPDRRARKDGRGAVGPYFVWQGYENGKHFSRRVSAEQAERLSREIEERKRFERLCAEYVALGEARADAGQREGDPADDVKKKPNSPSRRTRKSGGS
jgi:hypothetical protein